MERSQYETCEPLESDEILEGLRRIASERAGHEADAEGLKGKLDEAKKRVAGCEVATREVLRALNEDRGVFKKKDGSLTTEPPDSQTTIEDLDNQ